MGFVRKKWTDDDKSRLREYYSHKNESGDPLEIDILCSELGRNRISVCLMAGRLGLTSFERKRPAYMVNAQSIRQKKILSEKGHPRGFLGHKHSQKSIDIISRKSQAYANRVSGDERREIVMKAIRTKIEKYGSSMSANQPDSTRSWKQGWRVIGGKRKFYRSRWEANYARYLQWLFERGEISGWEHEPETFWFDKVKRGCVSYLPDFRVINKNGVVEYHEVKGWFDDRSKTKIKRMAKYHPQIKLIVIDGKAYKSIDAMMAKLIKDWE